MPLGRRSLTLLLALLPLTGCKSKPAPNTLFPITFQTDWYPQPEMGAFTRHSVPASTRRKG